MTTLLTMNTPLGAGKALIKWLKGEEYLGSLPVYHAAFLTDRASVSAADLLGKNVTIGLDADDRGKLRHFNGYVTQLEYEGTVPGDHFGKNVIVHSYVITVHPWLYYLQRRKNSRIFQNKDVAEILELIFKEYPFAVAKRDLNGTYPKREYCSQYRETDFDFVSRLMEHEGIYYWFSHDNGKHVMHLCDGASSHKPAPGCASIEYDDTGGGSREERRINGWNSALKAQSGRFASADYNFKTPKADMNPRAKKEAGHALDGFEVFDHGEVFVDKAQGERYAKLRSEEAAARHNLFAGHTRVRGLTAGMTFKLSKHPRSDYNMEYLIVGSTFTADNGHQGISGGGDSGAGMECHLTALDGRVPYRSPRVTAKPTVPGPHPAVVVGPAKDEIHTDEHGRVKVQFYWDRYSESNENSSCWLRVSQPIAGKEWGAQFLPRIGQEVIVQFLDGDPDWPIITGRLYNADVKPPWPLPANKTRSGFKTRTEHGGSDNFNELRFEDKQGSEEIYLRAERDHVLRIKHDRVAYVGNDAHLKIKHDRVEQIGNDQHLKIAHDYNISVGDNHSLTVQQDWQAKAGNRYAVKAGNEIHLNAGMKAVIEAGAQLTLKVGGSFLTLTPSGVFISGMPVAINSGGSAASGTGASPEAPTEAKEAPDSQGGQASGDDVKPPQKPDAYSPQAQSLALAQQTAAPTVAMS
jgi:type VI secretion system secreted protein VgrG